MSVPETPRAILIPRGRLRRLPPQNRSPSTITRKVATNDENANNISQLIKSFAQLQVNSKPTNKQPSFPIEFFSGLQASSKQATEQPTFPFEKLPAELRLIVYKHYFDSLRERWPQRWEQTFFIPEPSGKYGLFLLSRSYPILPHLCFVNKLIGYESSHYWMSTSHYCITDLQGIQELHMALQNNPSGEVFDAVHEISATFNSSKLYRDYFHYFHALKKLINKCTSLRKLDITFKFHSYIQFQCHVPGWDNDLGCNDIFVGRDRILEHLNNKHSQIMALIIAHGGQPLFPYPGRTTMVEEAQNTLQEKFSSAWDLPGRTIKVEVVSDDYKDEAGFGVFFDWIKTTLSQVETHVRPFHRFTGLASIRR